MQSLHVTDKRAMTCKGVTPEFEVIIERIGPVAYRLELPQELSKVHNVFHICNLKKCLSDDALVIPLEEIQLDDKLNFIEEPVEIMDREVSDRVLYQFSVPTAYCSILLLSLSVMSYSDELIHSNGTTPIFPRYPDTLPYVYTRGHSTLRFSTLPPPLSSYPTSRRTARMSVIPVIEPELTERARGLYIPQQISRVHNTFHVSNLKKCLSDELLVIPLDELRIDDKLHFVKELVEIMDHEIKQLKKSRIPIIKVRWNSKRGPEFTWEREDQFRKAYPHLFTKTVSPSSN
ncbi:hypothetical protein Tco_0196319 [Tanacetum coccineum]